MPHRRPAPRTAQPGTRRGRLRVPRNRARAAAGFRTAQPGTRRGRLPYRATGHAPRPASVPRNRARAAAGFRTAQPGTRRGRLPYRATGHAPRPASVPRNRARAAAGFRTAQPGTRRGRLPYRATASVPRNGFRTAQPGTRRRGSPVCVIAASARGAPRGSESRRARPEEGARAPRIAGREKVDREGFEPSISPMPRANPTSLDDRPIERAIGPHAVDARRSYLRLAQAAARARDRAFSDPG